MKRFGRLGAAAFVAVSALAVLVFAGPSAGGGKDHKKANGARSQKAIMFASDGMRPDLMERYARLGRHADVQRADPKRRAREERPQAGLPAEHRRRLAHACHRHLAG